MLAKRPALWQDQESPAAASGWQAQGTVISVTHESSAIPSLPHCPLLPQVVGSRNLTRKHGHPFLHVAIRAHSAARVEVQSRDAPRLGPAAAGSRGTWHPGVVPGRHPSPHAAPRKQLRWAGALQERGVSGDQAGHIGGCGQVHSLHEPPECPRRRRLDPRRLRGHGPSALPTRCACP